VEPVETLLVGQPLTTALAADAGEAAASSLELADHTSMPVSYRRQVVRGLVRQAVLEAFQSASSFRTDADGQ
jgi:CO/xanthine dehydrogenase FAD-binding subunit